MEHPEDDKRLLDLLVRATAGGKLEPEMALPVVTKLLMESGGDGPVTGTAESLLELLDSKDGAEFVALADWLRARRMVEALRYHRGSRRGLVDPGGGYQFFLGELPQEVVPAWDLQPGLPGAMTRGCDMANALAYLKVEGLAEDVPELVGKLEDKLVSVSQSVRREGEDVDVVATSLVGGLDGCSKPLVDTVRGMLRRFEERQRERVEGSLLVGEFPKRVSEEQLLESLKTRVASADLTWGEKRSIVIACCRWKSPVLEPVVRELCSSDPRLGEIGSLMLRMRFGEEVAEAENPGAWFSEQRRKYEQAGVEAPAAAVLRVWLASGADLGEAGIAELDRCVAKESELTGELLAHRWEALISDAEWETLTGGARGIETVLVGEKAAAPEPKRRLPALWAEHVQPFVVENWYMVAGIFMTIVGASLLAFYTWDRHWLIRYTLMPGMLALFTAGLARAGTWIAAKGSDFFGTASMLRGAAIGLLPVNFMAVALLSRDEAVSQKLLAVSAMGLIYVVLAGWGLWRWCRAEHCPLGLPMGGTLLMLNALVALGPLAQTLYGGSVHQVVVGIGFYVGFALVMVSVIWFGTRCLDAEMLRERRVPWFFFVGLAATFIQVFLWVHGHAGNWPQVHTYAPLLVMAGGLALFFDLRAAAILGEKGEQEKLGGISSLGFGLIFLGLVMGMGDERSRVLAFLLAGLIWVGQAVWRGKLAVAHFWIGLTLLALSVASVGLLEAFPKPWLPALGVGAGLLCLLLEPLARGLRTAFAEALRGMHYAALAVSVVVAVMTQWHLKTTPELTGLWLVAIAALFGNGARREQSVRWVHVGMVVLAMSIPYFGFVDMRAHDWRGNTVVFALGLLSIAWIAISSRAALFPTAARGRSTVLWFYGWLAVVAMVIRIYWEGARPAGMDGFAKFMDLGGPLLMAGALMAASYFSRSLVAGGMAAVILVILFPELKATFEEVLPQNLWGSGIGSSSTAVGLLTLAFWLRRAKFLRELTPGDCFLDRYEFPLRRFDHTLATWPVVASACFLIAKIVLLNVPKFFDEGGLDMLHGLALVLCAVAFGLLAVYLRKRRPLPEILVNVGLALLVVASFALTVHIVPDADFASAWWAFFAVAFVLYLVFRFALARWEWAEAALAKPVFWGLAAWSLIAGWEAIGAMAFSGQVSSSMWLLVGSLVGLFGWQELRLRFFAHGVLLFALGWTALLVSPLDDLNATLWMLVAVFAIGTGLEFFARGEKCFRPLMRIELWLATLVAVLLGTLDLMFGIFDVRWFGLLAIALAARTHRSTPIAVLAVVVGCFWIGEEFRLVGYVSKPGALGLLIALLLPVGSVVLQRWPKLMRGLRPQRPFNVSNRLVVVFSAAFFAITSAVRYESASWSYAFAGMAHTPMLADQLPIFALLALVVLACFERSAAWGWAALALSVQVNAHFANDRFGDGFDPWQLFAMGVAMSLLALLVISEVWRRDRFQRFSGQAVGVLGGLILLALGMNFLMSEAFVDAATVSLLVSAAIAYVGARGLRRAARKFSSQIEPLYHTSLVVMVWCAAFAIPGLRGYQLVLLGIFSPALYFWWRAERGDPQRFRWSALAIAGLTIGMWLLRDLVASGMYRLNDLPDDWYHFGAPVLVLAGAMMMRLGSGAAVPVMMIGSYFCVTAIPGTSPFGHATVAGWVAVVLGHVWIWCGAKFGGLRKWFSSDGALEFLMAMVHVALLPVIVINGVASAEVLLLVACASVTLHVAFVRERYWLHALAVAEVLYALYVEATVGSVLAPDGVIWVVLGLWAVNLLWYDRVIRKVAPGERNDFPLVFGLFVFAQVVWQHGAESWVGLVAVGIGALLAAAGRAATGARYGALLLLAVPVWLAFFGVWGGVGTDATMASLLAAGVALAIAAWARSRDGIDGILAGKRLMHRMLEGVQACGAEVCGVVNWGVLVLVVEKQMSHTGQAFGVNELLLMLALYLAIAISFARHQHFVPRLAANLVVQLCALQMFQALRSQLLLTTDIWQPVYDLWATILASFILVGCRELRSMSDWQSRASLVFSLCAMPVAGLAMVEVHDLGTDAALLVVGVQSMIFAYLGRGSRESPYNVVAIFGFVAFVMLVFWTKFEFDVAHAYVVPAGLGVLALLQLFQRVIPLGTRSLVRLVTLLAMLGSTGYSALLDDRYPVVFHLTMLVLCLACMGLGSLLRVRLYLYLGFTGLLVNLGSILHKVLGSMERGTRMTAIGSLVLAGGILVLAAAIYYKTHRGAMDEVIRRWRMRLAAWE